MVLIWCWVLEVFFCGQSGIDYDQLLGDLGWFGFDSVIWCLYVEFFLMFVGGLCVLMLQILYLCVLVGVYDYFNFCQDLVGCLCCIMVFVVGISYVFSGEVEVLVVKVCCIYVQIRGQIVQGEFYVVDDLQLLIWVYVIEVFGFLQGF